MSKNQQVAVVSHNITRTEGEVKAVRRTGFAGPNVAGNAKKGEANRKQLKKLRQRMVDYSTMMSSSSDPTGRKGSGGYHRPGSMQL